VGPDQAVHHALPHQGLEEADRRRGARPRGAAAQKKPAEAKRKLEQLIRKHQTGIIAIGNGTGCRETEQLVAELISELENRRLNPQPAASPIPQATAETPTLAVTIPDAPTVQG
jgi:uncharacterized protein